MMLIISLTLLLVSSVHRDLTTPLASQLEDEKISAETNFMEGYLTKKGMPNGVFTDPWSRRYFVLQVRKTPMDNSSDI